MTDGGATGRSLSDTLAEIPFPVDGDRATVADFSRSLESLAHSAAIFLLASLGLIPAPPGVSVLVGVPLVAVIWQKLRRRLLRLPGVIMRTSVSRRRYEAGKDLVLSRLRRAEKWLHPRGRWHARPALGAAMDWFVLALAIGMLVPLPLTAMLPALCICAITLGRLAGDGRWIAAGLLGGALSLAIVSAMTYATVRLMGLAFTA